MGLVSVAEAARMAGVSERGVRTALGRGKLKGEKVKNIWYVCVDDLQPWRERVAQSIAEAVYRIKRIKRKSRYKTCSRCGIVWEGDLCPDCQAELRLGRCGFYQPGGAFWSHE